MYLDLVNTPGAFAGVAAYWDEELAVGRGLAARSISGRRVTASYFTRWAYVLGSADFSPRTKTLRPRRTGQHDDDRVWFFRADGNVGKPGGAEGEQAAGDREGCGLLPAARSQSQRTDRISPRVVVLPKRLLDHKGSRKDRCRG